MRLHSPAWIIAAGLVLAQASGVIGTVGQAITGIDQTVTGIIDLKKVWKTVIPLPPFPMIKPIVIPKQKSMPMKAVKQ